MFDTEQSAGSIFKISTGISCGSFVRVLASQVCEISDLLSLLFGDDEVDF